MFVQSALHQLKVAIDTSIQMLNRYKEDELKYNQFTRSDHYLKYVHIFLLFAMLIYSF